MKGVAINRATWIASVALASIALAAGFLLNQRSIGLGLALGLVVGAGNGHLIKRVIDTRAPFVVAGVARMLAVGGAAIMVGLVLGASLIAALLGVATAQLVMVAAAVREGLRA